ncbi:MAG: sugar phosphate isomerase/epimerase [Clostridia bacterium]|nr:sugar phosphate isomerase/epimerase [Clostridia bacterium]
MMKLGMINNRPTDESLTYIKSLGLSFIEVCNNNDEESVEFSGLRPSIYEMVKRNGLSIGSIGRWNPNANVGGNIREESYRIMERNLEDAIAVGAPTFVCSCNYDDSVSLYRNYTAAIELFGRFLDRAKGTGTSVAVCNCSWNNFVVDMETWRVVLGELPELKIKWDPSHSYHSGRDYMREVSDWGSRFAHIHVKGAVKTNGKGIADPPAGLDALPWPAIFACLYSCEYDGCLSIEPHSGAWRFDTERGKAGVKYTVDYISRFIM